MVTHLAAFIPHLLWALVVYPLQSMLRSPPTIVQQPAQENSEDEWGGGKAEEEGLKDFISPAE